MYSPPAIAAFCSSHPHGRELLSGQQWNGKIIKGFLNAEYELLTKLFGLSGSAGRYPCLWCKMPRNDMHSRPPATPQQRHLAQIKEEHKAFVDNHDGDKKHAARYYNCRYLPLLDIDIDQVAPPYLHILLGVVKKHHNLLGTPHSFDSIKQTEI